MTPSRRARIDIAGEHGRRADPDRPVDRGQDDVLEERGIPAANTGVESLDLASSRPGRGRRRRRPRRFPSWRRSSCPGCRRSTSRRPPCRIRRRCRRLPSGACRSAMSSDGPIRPSSLPIRMTSLDEIGPAGQDKRPSAPGRRRAGPGGSSASRRRIDSRNRADAIHPRPLRSTRPSCRKSRSSATLGRPSEHRSPFHSEVIAASSAPDAAVPPGRSWARANAPCQHQAQRTARGMTRRVMDLGNTIISRVSFGTQRQKQETTKDTKSTKVN